MSDADLTVNFLDENIGGGDFEPMPGGSYLACLTDWTVSEVKKEGGKLPTGTPGINAEFTIQDGPYENRKVWNNFWLAPSTLGFMKSFFKAIGWSDDQINGITDAGDAFDQAQSVDLVLLLKVRKSEEYGDSNNIRSYKPASAYKGPAGANSGSSMLP